MNALRRSSFLFALALIAASCGSSTETTGAVSSDDVASDADSDSANDADSGEADDGAADAESADDSDDADGDADADAADSDAADGDDDAAGTGDGADSDTADDGDDDGDADSGGSGAAPTLEADEDDEVYVELILDCVYGENEAGSCAELQAAGLDPDRGYGLGNSMTQIPDGPLRQDCIDDASPFACAELNLRVNRVAQEGEEEPRLLCLFHSVAREGEADPVDAIHLATLLGNDAPVGVGAAVETIATDPSDADALDSLQGYLDPVCAEFLD